MKHLRWSAAGLCIVALAACDSTPVEPDATPGSPDGALSVTAPVFGAVPVLNEVDGHLYEAVAAAGRAPICGAGRNGSSGRRRPMPSRM